MLKRYNRSMIEELFPLGVKILLVVYRAGGEEYITNIIRKGGVSAGGIYRSLSVLLESGLIYYEKKFNRRFVVLTREGVEVAKRLDEADKWVKAAHERVSKILRGELGEQ